MGHGFESADEAVVAATPEQVWAAIATGPGIDSWFMGHSEVSPGESVRTEFGGYAPDCPVTAWEPMRRLAYGTEPAADGRFVAYEFLVEGRDRGSTVVRVVTHGFLPGDDWADEYDAMTKGGALFFATLVEYLRNFAGRTATPVTVFGPTVTDWAAAWAKIHAALHGGSPGDTVVLPDGSTGVVYFANPQTLGIRTGDALYRLLQGFHGPMIAAHHLFTDEADPDAVAGAWQTWLARVLTD